MVRPWYGATRDPVVLTVGVRDGGGRAARVPAKVRLSLVSSNQRPPVFTRTRYAFEVREGSLVANTPVGTVSAAVEGESPEHIASFGTPFIAVSTLSSQERLSSTNRYSDQ